MNGKSDRVSSRAFGKNSETANERTLPVFLVFLVICVAAFATRLLPLSLSQYPFNNDSLTECGIASEIISSGHLQYAAGSPWSGTHSVSTAAYNIVLAFFASSLGVTPLQSTQLLVSVISIATVGAVFLLARSMSGSPKGGLIAGIMAVLLGTFVFTTGSAWKESLGMAFLALLFCAYIRRDSPGFRALTLLILLVLPLVHHLVAAVGLMSMAYLLIWSWLFAAFHESITRRHWLDTMIIAPPIVLAIAYYSFALPDRESVFPSQIKIALIISCFVLGSLVTFILLSMRWHSKRSFAPIVGVGFLVFLLLDYLGYVFPYTSSASEMYIALILASAFLVSVAWYGSEIIFEKVPVYRAVQVALIISPLSLIAFALTDGASTFSNRVSYRTFDFFDFFIFTGVATTLMSLSKRGSRKYVVIGLAVLICAVTTFPFGYYSAELLGVRHDTQGYETDALDWISGHSTSPRVVTDERLSYIAQNYAWLEKYEFLPQDLIMKMPLGSESYYMMEDSWTTIGVNSYPLGRVVISDAEYSAILTSSEVQYLGGPVADRIVIFTPSIVGATHG